MPFDWQAKYGYKPLLVETFVDCERFKGTCYRAANWIYLGKTEGKGRRGAKYFFHGKIRDYYVYPLGKDALSLLKQPVKQNEMLKQSVKQVQDMVQGDIVPAMVQDDMFKKW